VTVLVTGSSGHLGEALVRTLQAQRHEVVGLDILPGAFTHRVGSITDRDFVRRCMKGVSTVLHAATLHKPHGATHSRQDFVSRPMVISSARSLVRSAARAITTASFAKGPIRWNEPHRRIPANAVKIVYTPSTFLLNQTPSNPGRRFCVMPIVIAGLDPPAGRSPFGEAKARQSIKLEFEASMDARVKPAHDE
jgi:nucleoside-diphosphate-sugar epimerase